MGKVGGDGSGHRAIGSAALNAYIHTLAGVPASAKEFRTWSGSVVAAATPDRGSQQAVAAFAAREGHRDVRLVWTDPGVQGAVPEPLSRTSSPP